MQRPSLAPEAIFDEPFWDAQAIKRRIQKLYNIALSHGDVVYYQAECDRVEALYKEGKRAELKERLVERRLQEIQSLKDANRGSRANMASNADEGTGQTSIRQLLLIDDQHWETLQGFDTAVPGGVARYQQLRRQLLPWKRFDAFIEGCGFYNGEAASLGITPLFCKRLWIHQVTCARDEDPSEPLPPSDSFLFDKIATIADGPERRIIGEELMNNTDIFANSGEGLPASLTFLTQEPFRLGSPSTSATSSPRIPASRRQSERIALPSPTSRRLSRASLVVCSPTPHVIIPSPPPSPAAQRRLSSVGVTQQQSLNFRRLNNAPPPNSVAIEISSYFSGNTAKDIFIRSERNDEDDASRLLAPRKDEAHSKLATLATPPSHSMQAGVVNHPTPPQLHHPAHRDRKSIDFHTTPRLAVGLSYEAHSEHKQGQVGEGGDDFPFAAISRHRFTRIIVAIVERLMPPPKATKKAASGSPHLGRDYSSRAPPHFPRSPSQQTIADLDYDERFMSAWRAVYRMFFWKLEDLSTSSQSIPEIMACANVCLAPLPLRVTQRVIFHTLETHLQWLLLPVFNRYCEVGTSYITRHAFYMFARDVRLRAIDSIVAAEIFDKTNQYDTEGLLENNKLENLEFDEFVDAILLMGCAQFGDSDIFPNFVTLQAKIWEIFRVLRRVFGNVSFEGQVNAVEVVGGSGPLFAFSDKQVSYIKERRKNRGAASSDPAATLRPSSIVMGRPAMASSSDLTMITSTHDLMHFVVPSLLFRDRSRNDSFGIRPTIKTSSLGTGLRMAFSSISGAHCSTTIPLSVSLPGRCEYSASVSSRTMRLSK